MKARWKFASIQLFVLVIALWWQALPAAAQADAPKIVGTWKLNLAKSKFGSGPPFRSRTLVWEWDGVTLKHTAETVEADGKRTVARFNGKFDGKDYAVFEDGSQTPARYVRLKRTDAYHLEITGRKDGKDLISYRHAISSDGKTDTITQVGVNPQGGHGTDVLVYDKQ